jgi:hypothetical protein
VEIPQGRACELSRPTDRLAVHHTDLCTFEQDDWCTASSTAPYAFMRTLRPEPCSTRLVVRRYGVMLVCDAPVAVDLAQAYGQPK